MDGDQSLRSGRHLRPLDCRGNGRGAGIQETKPPEVTSKEEEMKMVDTTQTVDTIREVARERIRQYQEKGRTREKDDDEPDGTLALAASYLVMRQFPDQYDHPIDWPWSDAMPKPRDRRADLVRAAAFLIAEIESLDRKEGRSTRHLNVPGGMPG